MELAEPLLVEWAASHERWLVTWRGVANGCEARVTRLGADPVYVQPLLNDAVSGVALMSVDSGVVASDYRLP